MDFKEVDTLYLTFGWIRNFFLDNGIVRIPEYLALALETCGIVYWLLIFVFFITLLVGYARQMSSFYFFYQYIIGQKLDNPYKPAVVVASLWIGIQILATAIAMGGVYYIKYGVLVLIVVVLVTLLLFLGVFVCTRFLLGKMSVKRATKPSPEPVQVAPVGERLTHNTPDPVFYLQDRSQVQATNHNDPQYMEALMILGLKPDFTKEELQDRYKKLIKKVHADKGGSDGLYLKVKQCYEYLLSRMD